MSHQDEVRDEDSRMARKIGLGVVVILLCIAALMFLVPAYSRYQDIKNANNRVLVSQIEIQNQTQMIDVENKKAQVRVADANGIAESQKIINSSLTANYLQYLAIQAQTEMAHSPNHSEVYIPVGTNGIPLVKTVNPDGSDPKGTDAK